LQSRPATSPSNILASITEVLDPKGLREGMNRRDTRKDSGRKGMTRHMTRRLVTNWQIFIFLSKLYTKEEET
jgi:hypothetical protein